MSRLCRQERRDFSARDGYGLLTTEAIYEFGRGGHRKTFAFRRVGQAGQDIFPGEVGEIAQDFVLRHPGSAVAEDVVRGDAQVANAGLASAFARGPSTS
jgi:hypothetical protein